MRALLDGGAPADAQSRTGSTPLWLAAQNGHAAAAALLCSRGASTRAWTRAPPPNGAVRVSVLDIAALNGREALAAILVSFGARRTIPEDQW